jgi:chemotaxis signal transduction protein
MNEANTTIADQSAGGAEDMVPHYLIDLGAGTYALPQAGDTVLAWVQRPQDPTYLPTLPPWCVGLVSQRNVPVLLIDLRTLLGIAAGEEHVAADAARHVFIERAGETLGFLVDRTRRFRMLPPIVLPLDGEFIAGVQRVGDLSIGILNIESIWRHVLRELGAQQTQQAVA